MANSILYFIDDYPGNILKNEIRHIAEEIMSYSFQSFNGGNAIEEAYSSIQSLNEGTYSKTYFIIDMDMPISYRLEREWSIDRGANNLNGILADEMGLGKTVQTLTVLQSEIIKRYFYYVVLLNIIYIFNYFYFCYS